MASNISFPILLTLCKMIISQSEIGLGIREVKFRRLEYIDDFHGKGGNLWAMKTCASSIQCVILCVTQTHCAGVFYNQQSRQCQGHEGTVEAVNRQLVNGTKKLFHSGIKSLKAGSFSIHHRHQHMKRKETLRNSQAGNQKLSRKPDQNNPNVSHGVSTCVHGKDSDNETENKDWTRGSVYIHDAKAKLEFHVYTAPLRWIMAEMFCADRGERLIRLDTLHKLNRVRLYLHIRTRTRKARVYVGGYCCCNGKVFWGTTREEPASTEHFQGVPVHPYTQFGAWISGVDHDTRNQLRLAKISGESNMFICERCNN